MSKLTDRQLNLAIKHDLETLREGYVPRRPDAVLKHPERPVTGNLKYNSLKVEQISPGVFRVFIDEKIAPYMPYTNEPWISPKWKGAKNPNEGWWERFCDELVKEISMTLTDSTSGLKRK